MSKENMTLEPIRNDELKKAIQELKKQNNKEYEAAMFKHLKDAKLLAPVIFDRKLGKIDGTKPIKLPNDVQIKFLLVNTSEGKSFFPAFTDLDEAKKLPVKDGEEIQFIVRTMDEYARLFKDGNNHADGIVVNPASENIVLPTNLVENFKSLFEAKETIEDSLEKGIVPKGVPVSFTEAQVYPTRVVNAVHDACLKDIREVSRVWFKMALVQHHFCYSFIVECDSHDQEVLQKVREAALSVKKDHPVLVFEYNDRLKEEVIQDEIALYDRELGF